LVASYFLAKGLPVHKKQLLADLSKEVKLTFFNICKTFFPLLAFAGNILYQMQLN
jgi:hypothetical protein